MLQTKLNEMLIIKNASYDWSVGSYHIINNMNKNSKMQVITSD